MAKNQRKFQKDKRYPAYTAQYKQHAVAVTTPIDRRARHHTVYTLAAPPMKTEEYSAGQSLSI